MKRGPNPARAPSFRCRGEPPTAWPRFEGDWRRRPVAPAEAAGLVPPVRRDALPAARRRSLPSASARRGRRAAGAVRPNKLAEEAKEPAWKAFLRQYRDLMQLVLVGRCVVSIIALQDVSTGLVVLGLTVVNALMGLHQEGKAAESVAALRQMLIMTANVRRDGQIVEVPAEELVPGDIVSFEAGDKVPADGRLLVAATLEIEEAGPHRREHPGGQERRGASTATTCRSATGSTWPT